MFSAVTEDAPDYQKRHDQFQVVRDKLKDILARSLKSLEANHDVQNKDGQQFIWGCYGCGNLVEGDRPDACPVCGALGVEFERFGPFYAATPEHLGQLTPEKMIASLHAAFHRLEI